MERQRNSSPYCEQLRLLPKQLDECFTHSLAREATAVPQIYCQTNATLQGAAFLMLLAYMVPKSLT